MAETSGITLALETGVPSYQVEDEEGRIHLLLHLPIEEDGENRWCLWRPEQIRISLEGHFDGAPNSGPKKGIDTVSYFSPILTELNRTDLLLLRDGP
jgi:hypothetical protein